MTDKAVYAEDVHAANARDAQHFAKLSLIARGKTPGAMAHIEEYAPGEWEVMFEIRALGRGQGFLPNGQRYSLVGATRHGFAR